MTATKEKVFLTEAQETLLIPLYSKATESRGPNAIFEDAKAQEILSRVDYDFARLQIHRKTAITLSIRARKLDDLVRDYLAAHPISVVLHLGCGLDSRCLRVERETTQWYDLDMPDVIALRRKFYEETPTYRMIPSSVTDLSWMNAVSVHGRPVFVVAEGLLMYLAEADVKALILKLRDTFPGCELVCDVFSTMTVRRSKDISSLGKTGAVIRWGIDDARDIEAWAPGIQLKEEWYYTQAAEIGKLGLGYRLAFRLAGLFSTANKAHRIVRFAL